MSRSARQEKAAQKRFREAQSLTDAVYARWDNPNGKRETIEKRIIADWYSPEKMAYWRLAAQSKQWGSG